MQGASSQVPVDEQSVFLNVPFDAEYSPLFVALIAGLTALGRSPRCVLEVPGAGLNRLERIFGLVASCRTSIHDLSRVSLSSDLNLPRFNMPFELGMAYALSRVGSHGFFLLEEKPYRLQISLSDLNGHDPHIHDGTQAGVLRCVLDCFGTPSGAPDIATLTALTKRLAQLSSKLQRQMQVQGVFHPYLFRRITLTAAELARRQSLIR
jgi:hypothetical protein